MSLSYATMSGLSNFTTCSTSRVLEIFAVPIAHPTNGSNVLRFTESSDISLALFDCNQVQVLSTMPLQADVGCIIDRSIEASAFVCDNPGQFGQWECVRNSEGGCKLFEASEYETVLMHISGLQPCQHGDKYVYKVHF